MFGESAEAALSLLEISNGFEEMLAVEIRPQSFGNVNLRVGELPKKEIAQPHLSARADDKIRIGQVRSVEVFPDRLFVNGFLAKMFQSAVFCGGFEDGVEGVCQFRSRSVIQCQREYHAGVLGR